METDSSERSLSWTQTHLLVSADLEQSTVAHQCLVFVRKARVLLVKSAGQCIRLMGFMAPEQTYIQILVGKPVAYLWESPH